MKTLKEELKTIVTRGPFRTHQDKDTYRVEQQKAMSALDAAAADVSIGATQGAQLLIEAALRHVLSMREIIEKGKQ